MNIMNYTSPNFRQSLHLYNNSESNMSLKEAQHFQSLRKQIHKVPDNIRMSIRTRKPKNHFRNFNSERERYHPNDTLQDKNNNQSKERQKVHGKRNFLINTKKIRNYAEKVNIVENTSFDEFSRSQRDRHASFLDDIKKKLVQQAQKSLYLNAKRSLQRKRRLSPLKRGSLVVQKKTQKKQLKITFLSIEKAPLTKLYQKIPSPEQQLFSQNPNHQQNFNLSMIQTNFTLSEKKQNSCEDSPTMKNLSMNMTGGFQFRKRKSLAEDLGITVGKWKKFVPPFERYYYRDFIWKVAFSNQIFLQCQKQYQKKFKIFIGKGNNSLLIKSLIKRRSAWWTFTQKYDEANFIWTQIKINDIFRKQKPSIKQQHNAGTKQFPSISQPVSKKPSYILNRNILNEGDYEKINDYMTKHIKVEEKLDGTMMKRNKVICKKYELTQFDPFKLIVHNHLPNNYIIGNKKALYYTMTKYYEKVGQNPFEYLPETYHVQNGLQDKEYAKFLTSFYPRQKLANKDERQNSPERTKTKNIWIVKPGEFTNRGNGINVCLTLEDIKKLIKNKQRHQNGNPKTFIIQSYLDKPFLYQRRKFDIRHYMMISSINGHIKGYWYKQGYIRTTSYEYSVKNSFASIHLTNDAVQKNLPDYGKYEKGNKLTYEVFQAYLEKQYGQKYNFFDQIYPKMKQIATDAMRACALTIDPEKNQHNFQVFGMDFMIDSNFKPWLIQINNNPCLQLSCPYLAEIIPTMVENAFRICLDPLFPPPSAFEEKRPKFSDNALETNKFQLVYDSLTEEQEIKRILNGESIEDRIKGLQDQVDEVFEDDGKELDD